MKPSARLRTRPRSASVKAANGAPSTNTSPADGASSPPSRCKSVLLPEPDAPTIATRSPARTSRSTPSSTGTSSGPLRYVLRRPRHPRAGGDPAAAASFIPQRVRRVDARRAPARIDRRDESQRKRDRRDDDHVGTLQVGWKVADVIDALVQELE